MILAWPRVEQWKWWEKVRFGHVLNAVTVGFPNGLAVEYHMESEVIGSQGSGLSHWKDELAIDLGGGSHRGVGWEEVEELREFRKKGPGWRYKLGGD